MRTDYLDKISGGERRYYSQKVERNQDEGNRQVWGYAAMFNNDSQNLGWFVERIAPGAFDDVLEDDCKALFNHDPNLVLARNKVTMNLLVDESGLRYEFDSPDNTTGNDLLVSLKRGDIDQSSFGFSVKEDEWEQREGVTYRTIIKVARLYDVSPVTFPAYLDTKVAKRSFEGFTKPDGNKLINYKRKLEILKLRK